MSHFATVLAAAASHPGPIDEALRDSAEAHRPTDPPGRVSPLAVQLAPRPRAWAETDLGDIDAPGASLGRVVERIVAALGVLWPEGGYTVHVRPGAEEDFEIEVFVGRSDAHLPRGADSTRWSTRTLAKCDAPYERIVHDLNELRSRLDARAR